MGSIELERTLRGLGVQSAGKLVVALSDPARNLPERNPDPPTGPQGALPGGPLGGPQNAVCVQSRKGGLGKR